MTMKTMSTSLSFSFFNIADDIYIYIYVYIYIYIYNACVRRNIESLPRRNFVNRVSSFVSGPVQFFHRGSVSLRDTTVNGRRQIFHNFLLFTLDANIKSRDERELLVININFRFTTIFTR